MSLYDIKIYVQNNWLLPVARRHPKLADLYYFLFSSDFSREHQKVLQGKYAHLKALKENKPNAFYLRRQVHRLEKGLIMKNRRPVFALEYIGDTISTFHTMAKQNGSSPDTDQELLRWTRDVLTAYFEATDAENQHIKAAAQKFEHALNDIDLSKNEQQYAPYKRLQGTKSDVSYASFLALTQQRRSVRYFLQKDIPYELIEQACRAASYSPSACNRQPFEFRIFTDQDMKNRVGSIPMGIRPYFENIPVLMVLVGKLDAYLNERDRHVIYLDGGLASMSFVLALETLGLSSVTINWPDIEFYEQQMDKLLNLGPHERPMMLIGLGYADPDGGIPFSQKKTPAQLLKLNL